MQKRPFTKFVPKALSLKYPLTAGVGNFEISDVQPTEPFRFHDCWEFVYCRTGTGIISCEGREFPFEADDILFISPYMSHCMYKKGADTCICEFIHVNLIKMFDPDIFQDIIEFAEQLLVPFSIPPVISGRDHPLLRELIDLILEELKNDAPYLEMSVKGYCMAVMAQLKIIRDSASQREKNAGNKNSLYPALLYMNRCYGEPISISQLASLCNFSETHFRRVFKSKFSMSPLEYLNFIRIQEACMLMSRNPILISQAAEKAGFNTLSTFSRNFRSVMEMTPSEWIRSLPEMRDKPQVIYY